MRGTKTQKAETTGCGLERGATPVQLGTGVSELSVPTSLMIQMVKNLSVMKEIWVQSMGQEEPLEKGMATHCSIRAWEIPWMEEPGGVQSMGLHIVGHELATKQRQTTLI